MLDFEEWYRTQLEDEPRANKDILYFTHKFITSRGEDYQTDIIYNLFTCGYCWYYAHMLQLAFHRNETIKGEVCLMAPIGHFAFVESETGIPYDISGIYYGEGEYYIPERYLGNAIVDFIHTTERLDKFTYEDKQKVIDKYVADVKNGIVTDYAKTRFEHSNYYRKVKK